MSWWGAVGWVPLCCCTAPARCKTLLHQEPVCVCACVCYLHCGVGGVRSHVPLPVFFCPPPRLLWLQWAEGLSAAFVISDHRIPRVPSPQHPVNAACFFARASSSQAQWPDSRRRMRRLVYLKDAEMIAAVPSGSTSAPSGLVPSGWCAERFPVCLCVTLPWKTPIPCLALGTAVAIMSPASAATASESSTATVPEEELESPREEVRRLFTARRPIFLIYVHAGGQIQPIISVSHFIDITADSE